jgi:hypothetical protein
MTGGVVDEDKVNRSLAERADDAAGGLIVEGQLLEVEKVLAAARAEGARRVSSALLPPELVQDDPA